MNDSYKAKLNAHYGRPDLGQAILDWLNAQGKDLNALTVEDLAPADQYHYGAMQATTGLAMLAISGPLHVADLGGGLGGPARYLASRFGCTVDVVDLAEHFCKGGEVITRQMRLDGKVRFFHRSATDSGLDSAAYDLVWMQNASMNIVDRPALYSEVRRILKEGGRYVFQEVFAGDAGPAYYPGGWATDPSESFIYSPEAVLRWLLDAGFRVLRWEDETSTTVTTNNAQNAARAEAASASTAPLPHYMSAEKLRSSAENAKRNAAEGRTRYARALLQKL